MLPSSWRSRRRLAWLAPLAVSGLVAGGTVLATAGPSTAAPSLPHLSAAGLLRQLITHQAQPAPLSGTVRETAALGLPSLPGDASSASLSWQNLLTGSHNFRVWSDGPARQRIAVLGQLSEADVVHRGRDVWTYTSATNTATHTVLPARAAAHPRTPAERWTPGGITDALLKAVRPSTHVSVSTAQRVAGRACYSLVLRPRDSRSTVRRVVVSVDASTFVPLRVQIFAATAAPAFSVGFSSVRFAAPPAAVFNFSVPPGARLGKSPGTAPRMVPRQPAQRAEGRSRPRVLGSGWTAVLEIPGVAGPSGAHRLALPAQLSTPIPGSSNRLIQTALINAVLRADGTVLVGAVRPALLEHLAATTR